MSQTSSRSSDESSSYRSTHQRLVYRHRGARGVVGRSVCAILLALPCGLVGCGSSLDEILFQTGGAVGRMYLDLLLTEVANTLADQADQGDESVDGDDQGSDDGDAGNGDAVDDGPDGVTDDGGFIGLTGDPVAGETPYTSNGCAVCHCDDAAGGCALDAPPLFDVTAETLDDFLRGGAVHASKVSLSDQEIVDLQAYLASLGTGGG